MRTLSQILREVPPHAAEEIQEYLKERVESVSRIDRVYSGLNPIKTAVEVRATRLAYKIMSRMLEDAMSLKRLENREKDPRDSFVA